MRCVEAFVHVGLATILVVPPLTAQSVAPPPSEAGPGASHALALARIGRSGLRSLLSASGSLGDLRDRAGSYRLAAELERARSAALEGRIAGLERALDDPTLPPEQRSRLRELRDAARIELGSVPGYRASYRSTTAHAEALLPVGFLGEQPVFLLVRGRGHARWDEGEGLTVFSEGVTAGPALASDRWIVAPGLSLGRTDVDIAPFDGTSGSASAGVQLTVGRILGPGWSAVVQLARGWARDASTVLRPGPNGEARIRTDGTSETTSGKAEVRGRFTLGGEPGVPVSVVPRVGVFVSSSRSAPAADGVGDQGARGPDERETLAALRAGASVTSRLGSWSPTVQVGWERELADGIANLVDDCDAVRAGIGLAWSWARGRRLSMDVDLLRGLKGRRRVSELTLVVILDG